ncbi:hypothetical protein BDV36DRAFT_259297 [Aspergillus pseudocaelatus]|uniref:Uncharacterized protein n=1 Tax=Aspergillus pseudocaelatus TaxID=1825620 RepID=A0ABQ6WHS5_9EURO|nr:hypothetical protein BDV36DRAFT_259297 [Aspergillus pseudocaelatus]
MIPVSIYIYRVLPNIGLLLWWPWLLIIIYNASPFSAISTNHYPSIFYRKAISDSKALYRIG